MKTIAVVLSLLVIVAVIQNTYAERGRRPPHPSGGGHRERPRRHHPIPCRLRNTTSGELLCNVTCPKFASCTKVPADAKPTLNGSLELHVCLPKDCTAQPDICPPDSTCQQRGTESRCLPNRRRDQHHSGEEEEDGEDSEQENGSDEEKEDHSCRDVIKRIRKENRPGGRAPEGGRPFPPGSDSRRSFRRRGFNL